MQQGRWLVKHNSDHLTGKKKFNQGPLVMAFVSNVYLESIFFDILLTDWYIDKKNSLYTIIIPKISFINTPHDIINFVMIH